jgi:hypothetical protein
MATTFFYHPAKNRDSPTPFVARVWDGEWSLLGRAWITSFDYNTDKNIKSVKDRNIFGGQFASLRRITRGFARTRTNPRKFAKSSANVGGVPREKRLVSCSRTRTEFAWVRGERSFAGYTAICFICFTSLPCSALCTFVSLRDTYTNLRSSFALNLYVFFIIL